MTTRGSSTIYLLLCLLVYCAGIIGYMTWQNIQAEKQFYSSLDRELFLVASGLKLILAPDFQDRATDKDAISMQEELRNRRAFNQLAAETGFVYVYTLVEKGGNFYFSAPTVTDEEAAEQERWYYFPYPDIAESFVEAHQLQEMKYATYTDQWGTFRSIALPQLSPGGRRYLACADMDISHIRGVLGQKLLMSFFQASFFFILSLPFIFFFMAQNSRLRVANTTLRTQRQRLEQNMAERLRIQDDLVAARNEAEKASSEKSLFLANMSHEIRTPLNIITGMSHLALTAKEADKQREYLNNIASSSNLLLRIINDILDFSKIEAGQLELENLSFGLEEVVGEVVRLNGVLAEAKGLALQLDLPDDLRRLRLTGDPSRLKQILINLVGNGIKFTESGFVVVSVSLAGEQEELMNLEFVVQDSGIGISEEQKTRIFRPFSQADGSYTRKFGGTGLGLVIVKRLTELMGGRISFDSESGQGSTFRVQLPFAQGAPEVQAGPGEHTLQFSPERVAGRKILVVDDHQLNRTLLQTILEDSGFTTVLAGDGKEALHLVQEDQFCLVLMDIQMPVMDGLAACREIRARNIHVPIVAMTSHAMAEDRQRSLAAGMNDHLTKPVELVALHERLVRWIDGLIDDAGRGLDGA